METLIRLRDRIRSGELSALEATRSVLKKVNESDLNCFISLLDGEEQAKEIDKKLADGFVGRLAGVPIAIKDNMRYTGSRTTCGSKALMDAAPDTESCAVVKKLLGEGAVIIGKTNMDEFAMGSSNTTSAFGPVLNPLDKTKVPGGSSGGSAAAVAAGLCYGALGSDTGGSIRQPASYCGVVGLRPTMGTVDGTGMYPLAQTMDQIGPITRTVDDNILLFEVLGGQKVTPVNAHGLKIGLIDKFGLYYTPETLKVIERARKIFSDCTFVDISAPSVDKCSYVYSVLGNLQALKNLSEFDTSERRELLGKEVQKRLNVGKAASADEEMRRLAQATQKDIIEDLRRAFCECDVIVSPTAPSSAFGFSTPFDRREVELADVFTQPASIGGYPAISVPCCTGNGGMPLGIQFVGRHGGESLLFALAKRVEEAGGQK